MDSLATKADIERLRSEIDQLKAELRADMQLMEQRIVIKLGGMLVVAVGVVAALVRLL